MNTKQITVIGSGVMGAGVAQLFAQYNYSVTLIDKLQSQLENAKNKIIENLRYLKLTKGLNSNCEQALSSIHFTTDYDSVLQAEFIIENITENWPEKKALYQFLNEKCTEKCILGVNTSAISITKIGSLLQVPEKVIGMHFMNPVPMMPLVEVIRGHHTSNETIEATRCLLDSVGRKMIVVNDSVGFVTNRAMMIFVNEAIFMVQEKVASIEEIDMLFRQCFNHKMGPLQTADLIGLDTILYSLEVLYEGFNDSKYRPCWLLKKMVDAGSCGQKSKNGFYQYE